MKRILMVEDGRSLVLAVEDRLTAAGYAFSAAHDGTTGLEMVRTGNWDLVIVDLMLPGLDGQSLIRRLRAEGHGVPVLILSAKNQMADRVSGLRVGADDYMTKPFSFDELLARVEAHLRRGPSASLLSSAPEGRWLDTTKPDFRFGEFTLSFRSGQVFRGEAALELPHQGFRLLCLLAEHPGEVLSTERILTEAWGYEALVTSRTVYVHVALLRKALRTPDRQDGHIATVRGIGYLFSP